MHVKSLLALGICAALMLVVGCRKTNSVDQAAFKSAINHYLSAQQECVWSDPVKFPAQATTSNEDQTRGFDALTDAGLLTRQSAEKKRFLVGSKQVSNYDLSDKGRAVYTADQTQPGYGNFCFGHREVTTIDNFTPSDDTEASRYSVNYHYDVAGLPAWASTTEMQTAFPKIAADTSTPQMATAILVKSTDGWQVSATHP